VVSLTDQGREAVTAAADMERSVLAATPIDPDLLRQELQAVVRILATKSSSAEAKAIVTAVDPGLAEAGPAAAPDLAARATPLN
jgi:hypothetical protein